MRSFRQLLPAVGAVSILVSLAAASPAAATCANGIYDEPLPPITSITPGQNTSREQTYVYPFRWTVISPLRFVVFSVRVASRPQFGETGILSDLVRLDDFALVESATDHYYYYAGQSSFEPMSLITWMDVPGTYYWQLYGEWTENGGVTCHAFASPINTITITPSPTSLPADPPLPSQQPPPSQPPSHPQQQPPRITLQNAKKYAVSMIRARTHRSPRSLRISCSRDDSTTLECFVRWSAGSDGYLANGSFTHQPATGGSWTWSYDFKAVRVWQTCRRPRHCVFHHSTSRWRSSGRAPL